jgi:hypothetical protein
MASPVAWDGSGSSRSSSLPSWSEGQQIASGSGPAARGEGIGRVGEDARRGAVAIEITRALDRRIVAPGRRRHEEREVDPDDLVRNRGLELGEVRVLATRGAAPRPSRRCTRASPRRDMCRCSRAVSTKWLYSKLPGWAFMSPVTIAGVGAVWRSATQFASCTA